MNIDKISITETNLVSFLIKFQEAVHNGFEVVTEGWECPSNLMFSFTATLERVVPEQQPVKKAGRPAKTQND